MSWLGSMQSALVATLSRPRWWAIALAAFLVRGGFVLILLPIITLPTTAALITALAPTLEVLVLGRPTPEGVALGAAVIATIVAAAAAAGLAGSWLDGELVLQAASDEELDLPWAPVRQSPWQAFAIRLAAHTPTIIALGYAIVRVVGVAYEELTAPGESAGVPVAERVLARVPDAVLAVLLAWLACEALGGLAARRAAAGARVGPAFAQSIRQLARPRGLATLAATSVVLLGVWVPFLLASSRAWEHLRGYLLDGADAVPLAAALILLVATWILGLAVAGACLAWRATAWTTELAFD